MRTNTFKTNAINIIIYYALIIFTLFSVKTGNANTLEDNLVRVSLDLEKVKFETALDTIEYLTKYKFLYKNEDIDLTQKVTIKATNKSLNYVLSELLKEKKINFKILNNQIILKKDNLISSKVKGRVIDIETNQPIYNCNIKLEGTSKWTSTNELGEFVINVESFPIKLTFSHLSYETHTVIFSDNDVINISLTPIINTLNEVVISGTSQYAIDLAKKAYNKTVKSSATNKYGVSFYRQVIKNDDDYSEFSEIIYDTQFSSRGIEKWDIIEGRYALKKEKVNNKNYTLLSKLLKTIQPNTEDVLFPLNKDLKKFYDVKIIQKIKSQNKDIAVLWFEPKQKNTKIPLFEGEVYINTKTYDILKVTGEIARDDLELIRLTEKDTNKKDYKLSYEMGFKIDSLSGLVIDYIDINQEFDYYKNNIFKTHISSKSSLNFFEYYIPTHKKKLGRQFGRDASDWYQLNQIGYNKKFWKENPFIKRTPVEEEVITSFEKDNAFESIFLNNRNQITQEQSDISNSTFIQELDKNILHYNHYNAIEKVYLHIDKNTIIPGEDIWYSAYVTIGPNNEYSLASNVLHTDVINPKGEIILSKKQKLTQGKSNGVITLPENLKEGVYQLRAYTNWMRNENNIYFFTKELKIIDTQKSQSSSILEEKTIDLQFFPEGGYTVAGLNNLIAYKAIGVDGLGKNIKGQIINSDGITVAHINSLYKGAGFFNLNPEKGKTYKAIIENNPQVLLPEIKDQGYVLSIDNKNERNINVKVQATKTLKNNIFYIIGHTQNQKYYQAKLEFGGEDIIEFEIPKNRFPSGVMTLTLLDQNMNPWCERALFINNQEEIVINTKINRPNLHPRNKLVLDITTTNSYGNPISTNLSVAVTDADKINKKKNSSNILSYLLLESDIKGHIENPALYFKDTTPNTRLKLDLVMLTHGWRKLNWKEVQNKNTDTIKKFIFTKGLHISGIIKDKKNKPLPNTKLDMIAKSDDSFRFYSSTTDSEGRFSILNFNHTDSTRIVFNVYNDNEKLIKTNITIDKNEIKPPLSNYKNNLSRKIIINEQNEYHIKAIQSKKQKDLRNPIALDEVLVNAKKTKKEPEKAIGFYGAKPDVTLFITKENNIQDLMVQLTKLPGVTVIGSGTGAKVSINRSQAPLWVIDGVPIPNENVSSGAQGGFSRKFQPYPQGVVRIPSIISSLSLLQIHRIDILKPGSASIYGSRGSEGVISIETKKGYAQADNSTEKQIPLWSHTIMGYSASKEFYTPKYDVQKPEHKEIDDRTTLLWEPNITTDSNGKATITFFNSDQAKQIQIAIEGLSKTGIPGAYLKKVGKIKN